MARPRKQKSEQRNERVNVRFTVAESSFLEGQALAAGVTVTDLIRRRALRLPTTPLRVARRTDAPYAALVNELNRIGVNLNQLAHAANRGERTQWLGLEKEIREVLEKVVMARGS